MTLYGQYCVAPLIKLANESHSIDMCLPSFRRHKLVLVTRLFFIMIICVVVSLIALFIFVLSSLGCKGNWA